MICERPNQSNDVGAELSCVHDPCNSAGISMTDGRIFDVIEPGQKKEPSTSIACAIT
jgi:hypothetical protein